MVSRYNQGEITTCVPYMVVLASVATGCPTLLVWLLSDADVTSWCSWCCALHLDFQWNTISLFKLPAVSARVKLWNSMWSSLFTASCMFKVHFILKGRLQKGLRMDVFHGIHWQTREYIFCENPWNCDWHFLHLMLFQNCPVWTV